jgi:hypothetical protein
MTDEVLHMSGAMLPCLSTTLTFTIELMVAPKQCSLDLNYSMIIGQESMRLLNLDMSVCDNTISWDEEQISMVPHDYWTIDA